MKFVWAILVFLKLLTFHGHPPELSNYARVTGYAPGMGGDSLVFYKWSDWLSSTALEIATAAVDENENFSLTLDAGDYPLYIFTRQDPWHLYMYIEPGKKYEIVLPERLHGEPAASFNRFLEGSPTQIAVLNQDSTELNNLVSSFDRIYEPLFGETLITLAETRDQNIFDSIVKDFNERFYWHDHSYFEDYMRYRLALFRLISQIESVRGLTKSCFLYEPVLYTNRGYMDLFNQVFDRYFLFFSRTTAGKKLFEDINNHGSYSMLRKTLLTDDVIGEGRLLELVILKGLHDSFYGSDFSRSGLLNVLDSLAATTRYSEHIEIAGYIRDKVTRLLPGFDPPGFNLRNSRGEIVSLADFEGYYIYLNFCISGGYGCYSDFELLQGLSTKHKDYLRVVTIMVDDSYDSMVDFAERSGYSWEFLYFGDQPSVLKDYDIRVFPTYYLIDRNGKVLLSPSVSPSEDFELNLFRIMRSRGEL